MVCSVNHNKTKVGYMNSIYEIIQNETMSALSQDSFNEGPDTKSFSVRLPVHYVNLLDMLAEETKRSRSSLLSVMLMSATDEALQGYASVFQDPVDVVRIMQEKAGFPVYTAPSKAE